jgi:ribosomal protein S18 acetylase RimI-like enzyme
LENKDREEKSSTPTGGGNGGPPKKKTRLSRLMDIGLFTRTDFRLAHYRATTPKDLEKAYRVVYRIFRRRQYIRKKRNLLRMRVYELCPSTATFVSTSPSHSIVGVLSVIQDSADLGLPSDAVFKKEIDALRGEGRRICEFSNQAIISDFRKCSITTELMSCVFAQAVKSGCTDIVCAVSPSKASFYEMVGFEIISEVKSYSQDEDDPVVLIRLADIQSHFLRWRDSDDEERRFFSRFFHLENPYFAKIDTWNRLNETMFSEQFEIAALFSKCQSVLLNSSKKKLSALYRRLGMILELARNAARLDRRATLTSSDNVPQTPGRTGQRRRYRTRTLPLPRPVKPIRHISALSAAKDAPESERPTRAPMRRNSIWPGLARPRGAPPPLAREPWPQELDTVDPLAELDSELPAAPDSDLSSIG